MSLDASPRSVREIFLAVLELDDQTERRIYLDEVCGVGTDRRREVDQLLAAHEEGLSSPLDDAVARLVPRELSPPDELPGPGIDVWTHPAIGPYKIREQIGEGGFGVVYVAEQTLPVRRKVALKVIKPGMDTQEVIARFEVERQALAMMDHPHIAKVFDAGTTDTGLPYFVMELICGRPLTQFCRENKCDLREQLTLFVDVCRAVQHAHQKGIIHRDLKPSNILITLHDGEPVVKVIDFGIAKALHQKLSEHTVYTRHVQMVGTPVYMSPEQAELSGLDVDTRSDVYSLGVLLYELLTGTPPFDKAVLMSKGYDEMRRIIREDDPPRPSYRITTLDVETLSTLQQSRGLETRQRSVALKRELDWIVMKALEKKRTRRYQSASDLAADVERYLNDEPVEACPPSAAYRLRKMVKRQKGLLMTLALVVLTAFIGMLVSFSYARRASISADEAVAAQRAAEDHAAQSAVNAHEAQENARAAAEAEEWSRTLLYASDMKLASDAIAKQDMPRAAEVLSRHIPQAGEADLRGFEWHFFQKQVNRPEIAALEQGGWVDDVEVSPNGKWLATAAAEGTVRLYETRNWTLRKSFPTPSDSIHGYAWSPDSERLAAACADGNLQVWDITTDLRILEIFAHAGGANDVVYSPDGQSLYSGGYDDLAKRWNAQTGEEEIVYPGHQQTVRRIALSPDGTRLATASHDKTFAIWESNTGKRLHHIEPLGRWFVCIRFSPDGQQLAAGNVAGMVVLVDVESGDYRLLSQEADGIEALTFLHNGQWLATADRGGAIQLHPVPTQMGGATSSRSPSLLRWIAHEGRALSLDKTADGQSLISGGRDGVVRVWSPDFSEAKWTLGDWSFRDIAIGPNHRLYGAAQDIRIWDLNRRRRLETFAATKSPWISLACSADGRFLVAVRIGQLALFDLLSLDVVREWPLDKDLNPGHLAISTDGRWIGLITIADQEYVTVYDRLGKREPRQLPSTRCNQVSFSPDGRWLATNPLDAVQLFDWESDSEPPLLEGHSSGLKAFAFSPDGQLLASGGGDRLLKIWRPETGEELFSAVAYEAPLTTVAFSQDGRTIAVAGDDLMIKFWHVATGQPLGETAPHANFFKTVQFSADGKRLIAVDSTERVLVYDVTPTQSVRAVATFQSRGVSANKESPPAKRQSPVKWTTAK